MTLYEPSHIEVGRPSKSKRVPKKTKRHSHQIDIDGFVARQRTYPTSKKDILGRAVGRKTEAIFDATGGWGGDALHLCSQGFSLKISERNSILAGFLSEALDRLKKTDWACVNKVSVPELIKADSIGVMREPAFHDSVDCIYLDPMFPEKRKRTALAKKNMQVLHDLIGEDDDQEMLFLAAYEACKRRVIVKRPDYAPSLGLSIGVHPSQVLQGKLMHYDIYLKH